MQIVICKSRDGNFGQTVPSTSLTVLGDLGIEAEASQEVVEDTECSSDFGSPLSSCLHLQPFAASPPSV